MVIEVVIKRDIKIFTGLVAQMESLGIFFYQSFTTGFSSFRFYISVSPQELVSISDFLALVGSTEIIGEEKETGFSFGALIVFSTEKKVLVCRILRSFGISFIRVRTGDIFTIKVKLLPFIVENTLVLVSGIRIEKRS